MRITKNQIVIVVLASTFAGLSLLAGGRDTSATMYFAAAVSPGSVPTGRVTYEHSASDPGDEDDVVLFTASSVSINRTITSARPVFRRCVAVSSTCTPAWTARARVDPDILLAPADGWPTATSQAMAKLLKAPDTSCSAKTNLPPRPGVFDDIVLVCLNSRMQLGYFRATHT